MIFAGETGDKKMFSFKIQAETCRTATNEWTFWQGSAFVDETSIQGWGESVFRGSKVMFVIVGDIEGNKGVLTKLHEKNIIRYDMEKTETGSWALTNDKAHGTLWFL